MTAMEIEMCHSSFPATTRYATYKSNPPEEGFRHVDEVAVVQIFVKELEKYFNGIPGRIKVTIESEDVVKGTPV
ncbi:MAG: hypothetical protein M1161_04710 [Candidatus Thermoplasmatota archaeon]|jgi:hypothetical protein|nr:hypothetical protein [Candidatus Thermoplasmatota archaeon]